MKNPIKSLEISFSDKEKKILNIIKVVAEKHGAIARIAGGFVRDKLLCLESHDIDIAINNMSGFVFANLVAKWMADNKIKTRVTRLDIDEEAKKPIETAMMPIFGQSIDFVQLRTDTYVPGSRKPKIVPGSSAQDDAERRDLTINSIFYNINEGTIEDYVGGVEDLKNGIARTPRDPLKTYDEDPLRILRAVRFAARFNLELDPQMVEAANNPKVQAEFRTSITKERIWSELVGQKEDDGWKKGFMIGPNFDKAAALMAELGLRDLLFTPTKKQIEQIRLEDKSSKWKSDLAGWDMEQNNPHHNLNVWEHTIKALNYLQQIHQANLDNNVEIKIEDQIVRNMAMLLHDIGKRDSDSQQTHPEKGHQTYHGHELSSAIMADQILKDLKAPTNIRKRVVSLIQQHMRLHTLQSDSGGSGLRRALRDIGADNWPLLVEISKSDSMGKTKTELNAKYDAFAQYIDKYLRDTAGKAEMTPPINGHEVMQLLKLNSGPEVGKVMRALREQMLENPKMTKDEAISFIKGLV